MNINNLPTDNLYKFIALSGLVLIFYSSFYIRPLIWEVEIEVARLATEIEVIEMAEDVEAPEAKKLVTLEKLKNMKVKNAVTKQKHEKYKSLHNENKLLVFIGLLLTCLGFYLWYYRVQRPIDQKLKNDAAN